MLQGTHHHPHKKPVSALDHFMYAVAFLSPLFTLPQFYDIWVKRDVAGVSLTTWGAYTVSSFLWLLYWKEHNEMWILISQVLIFALNLGIVAGILLYSVK